ncbi:defensin Ec-AMP-D2 [Impatiens glandulifera]|uniref:defensin Ec-AMP-D2 n=1 Tax=Impatiens glandulifera TaxID=253017 RepID=UPI001FB0B2A1|nr:defensin Ec-AMP-D2 [Impatiens glandulifera]
MGKLVHLSSVVLLVIMLLMPTEMMGPMVVVEAGRKCESQSHRFKGTCFRQGNCAAICQTEGFHGGHCRGFRRRCFCTKHC